MIQLHIDLKIILLNHQTINYVESLNVDDNAETSFDIIILIIQ